MLWEFNSWMWWFPNYKTGPKKKARCITSIFLLSAEFVIILFSVLIENCCFTQSWTVWNNPVSLVHLQYLNCLNLISHAVLLSSCHNIKFIFPGIKLSNSSKWSFQNIFSTLSKSSVNTWNKYFESFYHFEFASTCWLYYLAEICTTLLSIS